MGEHCDRSEDGYTRNCVGNVFVAGIGGNDCGSAADRRCGRDELGEIGLDASPIQMVTAKEVRTVATTMPRAPPPISMAWLEVN